MARAPIRDFELANPIYKNATVSFYTVASGVKTSTLATLYAGPSGATQLSNPQKLNSQGQFKQAVYIDAEVIGTIVGISVPGHDTAIYSPYPQFRVQQSSGKFQYSHDVGVTWDDSGDYIFRNRGAWVTAANYNRNDIVANGGILYLAVSAHTAGIFATDLGASKWTIILDLTTLSATGGSDLLGFIRSGVGAVASTAQRKMRDFVSVFDSMTAAEIAAVQTDTWTTTTNVTAAVQTALTAAEGKRLYFPSGTYRITSALNYPNNIDIEGDGAGTIIEGFVLGANFSATTSKSNIHIQDIKFVSEGTYSMVHTFTLCNNVTFDDCIFDLGLTGGTVLSSQGIRSYGSTYITVRGCSFYDCDSMIYLDKSGATLSDYVHVSHCHFEHRFLGNTNNPTGIYQYNCNNLLVDSCTFRNIAPGGGAPISGYDVYEGDGSATSLIVANCLSVNTANASHVMVQNSNAPQCIVSNNRLYTPSANYPTKTWFSWLYYGSPPLGSVTVSNNFADGAGIFMRGTASAATATRSALIRGNQLQHVIQSLGGVIRVGNVGSGYVHFAEVAGNSIYHSYGESIGISNAAFAVVEKNYCANWNTSNRATGTAPYSMAINWEANAIAGVCRGNVMENNTQVGADVGYPVDGIYCDTAVNTVEMYDNTFDAATIAGHRYNINCTYAEFGTWIPSVGGTATYTGSATGIWKRRGKSITLYWDMTINAIGTGSANEISGIPAHLTTSYACGVSIGIFTGGAVSVVQLGGYVSGVVIQLVGATAAATSFTNVGPMGNGTHISGSAAYLIP